MAREIKEAEDLQEAAAYKSRLARATGNPSVVQREVKPVDNTPSPSTGKAGMGVNNPSTHPRPNQNGNHLTPAQPNNQFTGLNQRTSPLTNLKKRTPTATAPTIPTPKSTATSSR